MDKSAAGDAIISIWIKISEECFQTLLNLSRRIKAVLKAKMGPTRY